MKTDIKPLRNEPIPGIESTYIAIILDTQRIKDDGTYPIKIKITHLRKRKYYPVNISCTIEAWQQLNTSRQRATSETRKDLNQVFDKLKNEATKLSTQGKFSFENLNKVLKQPAGKTINELFQVRIDQYKADEKHNTSDWYKYALNSLQKFAGLKIPFSKLTVEFLKKYESYMHDQGKSYTTISMYMRALQAITNEAKDQGIIQPEAYPFGSKKYSIPQHNGRKLALIKNEIKKIFDFECTGNALLSRDLWMFSYLCNGANITDIAKLKYSDIKTEAEQNFIVFYRQKTFSRSKIKKAVKAVLRPEMQSIIERHGNTSTTGYIFPFLNESQNKADEIRITRNLIRLINDNMQRIAKELNIPANITTYTARHSFATILKREGVSIDTIQELLDHAESKTTQAYLDEIETTERIKIASILTQFTNNQSDHGK